ncbi:SDR family NAD(P)-dependent oxidoreductase, partial [Xanthomonas campestris]
SRAKEACPEWTRPVAAARAAVSLLAGPAQPDHAIVTAARRPQTAPSAARLAGLQFPLPAREISP